MAPDSVSAETPSDRSTIHLGERDSVPAVEGAQTSLEVPSASRAFLVVRLVMRRTIVPAASITWSHELRGS
jgi:hypothetical protein